MKLEPRDIQTQIKHEILDKYLNTWGGIILNGLKHTAWKMKSQGRKMYVHFAYVDCFAYVGKYSGNTKDIFLKRDTGPVPGSPIIGINALDHLVSMATKYDIDLKTTVVLIEKKRQEFCALVDNLTDEGFGPRLKYTTDFLHLNSGDIAIVHEDATTLANELLTHTTQQYTWAFYLLDPYGAMGIPYDFVRSIVQKDKHDVMINFVYYDLEKKAGSVGLGKSIPSSHQAHIDHWTTTFNSKRWIQTKQTIEELKMDPKLLLSELGMTDNEIEGDPLLEEIKASDSLTKTQITNLTERQMVELYKSTLQGMDVSLAIKTVRLRFPDKDRTMFYLFLTTHDGTGALALNEILNEAVFREHDLRYIRRILKKQLPPPGQLSLFPPQEPEVPAYQQFDERPTTEECAENILKIFSGRTIKRREMYKVLADEIYFEKEIRKALTYLKKKGKVHYDGNTNDTLIQFSRNSPS